MILITSIIFFIAIITAFGMLAFRSWEVRTGRIAMPEESRSMRMPDIPFRQIERSMLYLTTYIVQIFVFEIVEWWFIITTRTRKWIAKTWPRFSTNKEPSSQIRPSFVGRAVRESKIKIRKIKERVKKEHGEEKKKEGVSESVETTIE
ncbi:MAG: hypothetical protein V4665_04645 [Patescibacteria group bacterium]